jgi:hypothetical protein
MQGNLEVALLYIHQSLEEDKVSPPFSAQKTDASTFAALDFGDLDKHYSLEVKQASEYLDSRLTDYRTSTGGTLTLTDFSTKFLSSRNTDLPFYAAAAMFRMKQFFDVDKQILSNTYASFVATRLFFELATVISEALHSKNPTKWRMIELLSDFCAPRGLILDQNKLTEVNSAFTLDFEATVDEILHHAFSFKDGTSLMPIEEGIALAYGFRNHGAHKVGTLATLFGKFDVVAQNIWNVLFYVVEKEY